MDFLKNVREDEEVGAGRMMNEEAYKSIIQMPQYMKKALKNLKLNGRLDKEIDRILIIGMGGSGIIGNIIEEWLEYSIRIPLTTWKDYKLPNWCDKNTLVIAISYSGETEETVTATMNAIKNECMIAIVTSDGRLLKIADDGGIPYIWIPKKFAQPREALPYLFIAVTKILEEIGILNESMEEEIEETIEVLKEIHDKFLNEMRPRLIAERILGKIITIYAYRPLRSAAQRFKQELNENGKCYSKIEFLPEAGHNDIMGWEEDEEILKNIAVIFLRDKDENEKMKRRIEVMKEIIKIKGSRIIEINALGSSSLSKIFSTIYLGDLISVELANLKGIDARRVESIMKLKEKLSEMS